MSEQDSELPDPLELFEEMERQARETRELEPETAGDDDSGELPDPEELFREMERYRNQGNWGDELPDASELYRQMTAEEDESVDEELPDPEELFERLRRQREAAPESVSEAPLPYIPDPDGAGPPLSRHSWEEEEQRNEPFIPLPDEVVEGNPAEPFIPLPDEVGSVAAAEPFIPLPDEVVSMKPAERFIPLPGEVGEESPAEPFIPLPEPFIPLPGEVGAARFAEPFIPLPDEVGSAEPFIPLPHEVEDAEPFIPLPDEVGEVPPQTEDSLPFIPMPEEDGQSFDSLGTWGLSEDDSSGLLLRWGDEDDFDEFSPLEEDSLPYIPAPDEAPQAVEQDPEETISLPGSGFLRRLKSRFGKPAAEKEPDCELEPLEAEPAPPARLPTPEELFRRMKAEREEAALNFEMESGGVPPHASTLPTPEELFKRMEEEYAEQAGGQLPELPDLEALKAEIEAEERARLDPDLESELAGPERFVETVSDNIFATEQLSFLAEMPPSKTQDQPESRLPFPQKPPVPPPPLSERPKPAPPLRTASPIEPAPPRPVAWRQEEVEDISPEEASPTGTVQVDPTEQVRAADNVAPTAGLRGRRVTPSYAKTQAEEQEKAKPKKKFKRFSRQKLSIFTRQMAVMLRSGIQLHMAVQFASESDPDLKEVLNEVMRKVESGYTFSSALGDTSRTFDHVYVGLIQSGEMSGRLHEIMDRLADALEREVELRKRLISVVTYPSVLLLVCFLGTLGFIFFVLPTLTPLFSELSVELPLPTKILLSSRKWILPVVGSVIGIGTLYFLLRDRITDFVRSKPMLERRLATVPFHIPVFGSVYEKLVTARVLYSLSTMLDVGITLNQAIARTEVTAGNALVAFRLGRARLDLADGVGVTDCFRFNQLFTPSALYLISAGEESARLAEMFAFVAKLFDEDVEYSLQSAANILEPLIMVVMGVIVGFITIAAALPTIHLLQNFS